MDFLIVPNLHKTLHTRISNTTKSVHSFVTLRLPNLVVKLFIPYRSDATILDSNRSPIQSQFETFHVKNSSLSNTQEFFHSVSENYTSSINSTFPAIRNRIKRCGIPVDLTTLKSRQRETRSYLVSKIRRQIQEIKNKRLRRSKSKAAPNSLFDSPEIKKDQRSTEKKNVFPNIEVMNLTKFTSTNEPNKTKTYGNEVWDDQSSTTNKSIGIFGDEYTKTSTVSTSSFNQTEPAISYQTIPVDTFDIIPNESKKDSLETSSTPETTSDLSAFGTDSSAFAFTLPMDTKKFEEVNQNNSEKSLTQETTTAANFKEMYDLMKPTSDSNFLKPDNDMLDPYQNIIRILNFTNDTVKENSIPKNDNLQENLESILTSPLFFNENRTQQSIIAPVEWPPVENREIALNSSRHPSSSEHLFAVEDLLTTSKISLITNETAQEISANENSLSIEGKTLTESSSTTENFRLKTTQEITYPTKNFEQTQIVSANILPQTNNPTSFTNYGNHHTILMKSEVPDSLSTPIKFPLIEKATSSQNKVGISTEVHDGLPKAENSVSSSTDANHFTKEMDNFSEDYSQLTDENLQFSTPAIVSDPPKMNKSKNYKLKHFLEHSSENLFERNNDGSSNTISKSKKSSHIPSIPSTHSPEEFYSTSTFTGSPTTTISTLKIATENWINATDSDYETETQEIFKDENLPPIVLFHDTESRPQDLITPSLLRKTAKIQPDEPVPPMNPNENWKIGQNDTYYTIDELRSFFRMKKKSQAARKGPKKHQPEVIIDLNGLNETTIIDFLKHNQSNADQNEKIFFNSTRYKIFKLFSNSTNNNFDHSGMSNKSINTNSFYSLIPPEADLYRGMNSSQQTSGSSDLKLEILKYLSLLKENQLNLTTENALAFFQELSSLNETFLQPTYLNKNDFENISNNNGILEENDGRNETEKRNIVEDESSSIQEELNIFNKKNITGEKSVNNTEKEELHNDEKNEMEGKSVHSTEKKVDANKILLNHNFLPEFYRHFKVKPRDPHEQLIKEQFNFVNPQIVDNFLDVYKRYSPRHSRSRMRQQNHRNYGRSNEDINWIPRPRNYRNEPPDNFVGNLLRELGRLRKSIPAAYVSHGYAN